ncbi:metal-binding protein [Halodesulfurarchaeum formicicum]|uniref:Metal-binding protein n=1 Tax=Halodesulfurarchaeum formicicum TaxID=1873524 RepID=A0A1D8S5N4_9EURY|nr:DUF2103 domain-containing protein [Halodesulfurarchaeum formicicum]AOW80660.1 metal-binding protein [Halodesulfurarchaeum formicicum]APE95999.1 metal-binding protein [Halodesulfurarchaeum formicicum]
MACRRCGRPLDRPGDYCLSCDTANADAVVLAVEPDRATLTMLYEERVLGVTEIPTTPETESTLSTVQVRNFAGRIADEIRRKRPDSVYVTGDRTVIQALRKQIHYPVYRVPESEPVETVLQRRGEAELDVIDAPPREKIGGSHSTVIGGRDGQRAIETIAGHPNVKKVVPGPIDAGGSGSRTGTRAKVSRSDENGNLRLVLRDGSSVQENRVVTTARDRETGERVREDLNEALIDADLRES